MAYCGGYGGMNNGQPCLFAFDLSSIPHGATITSAQLRLYGTGQTGSGMLTLAAYALLRPWVETQTTWNRADATTTWGLAGAESTTWDREAIASATKSAYGSPANWTVLDITGLVQRWVNGSLPNYGVKIQKVGGTATNILFTTREAASNRPQLVVNWVISLPMGTATATSVPAQTATATPSLSPTATPTHSPAPTMTSTPTNTPVPYTKRVNAGGRAYIDSHGYTWEADQPYTPGGWGYTGEPVPLSTTNGIGNTTDDPLYQVGQRWNNYRFTVPNGQYSVTLKFAEVLNIGIGARIFSIQIEGQPVLTNFDIVAAAGGAFRAMDRTVPVTVSDGILDIRFVAIKGAPLINALEVRRTGP